MIKHMQAFVKAVRNKLVHFRYSLMMIATAVVLGFTTMPVSASTIGDSTIGVGLKNLINDVSRYLMILVPIVMVVFLVYFFIRKAMADEMDQKKWNTRISTTIISCVGAFVAAVIVNLAQSYFAG